MIDGWRQELRSASKAALASVRNTFPHNLPLYVCAVLFTGITVAITSAYHVPLRPDAGSFFFGMVWQFAMLTLGLIAAFEFGLLARSGFPANPLSVILRNLLRWLLKGDRFGNLFHACIVFPILTISFCALKDQIPQINPFSWDKTFMQIDHVLTFGSTPWTVLQPLFGSPPITAFVNVLYNVWFLVLFAVLFWQAFSTRMSVTRLQYLLAYSMAWFIAGNLLAVIFSSAGPCFYGRLHIGPDPYAAQMAYLNYAGQHWPSWALVMQDLWVQNRLWEMYVTHSGNLGGISAMPSMHITSTAVMMLLAWKVDRRLGIAFTIFMVFIVIGSVRLGWHYLADDIAGVLLAAVFWVVSGRIAQAWEDYLARRHSPEVGPIAAVAATEA